MYNVQCHVYQVITPNRSRYSRHPFAWWLSLAVSIALTTRAAQRSYQIVSWVAIQYTEPVIFEVGSIADPVLELNRCVGRLSVHESTRRCTLAMCAITVVAQLVSPLLDCYSTTSEIEPSPHGRFGVAKGMVSIVCTISDYSLQVSIEKEISEVTSM